MVPDMKHNKYLIVIAHYSFRNHGRIFTECQRDVTYRLLLLLPLHRSPCIVANKAAQPPVETSPHWITVIHGHGTLVAVHTAERDAASQHCPRDTAEKTSQWQHELWTTDEIPPHPILNCRGRVERIVSRALQTIHRGVAVVEHVRIPRVLSGKYEGVSELGIFLPDNRHCEKAEGGKLTCPAYSWEFDTSHCWTWDTAITGFIY